MGYFGCVEHMVAEKMALACVEEKSALFYEENGGAVSYCTCTYVKHFEFIHSISM